MSLSPDEDITPENCMSKTVKQIKNSSWYTIMPAGKSRFKKAELCQAIFTLQQTMGKDKGEEEEGEAEEGEGEAEEGEGEVEGVVSEKEKEEEEVLPPVPRKSLKRRATRTPTSVKKVPVPVSIPEPDPVQKLVRRGGDALTSDPMNTLQNVIDSVSIIKPANPEATFQPHYKEQHEIDLDVQERKTRAARPMSIPKPAKPTRRKKNVVPSPVGTKAVEDQPSGEQAKTALTAGPGEQRYIDNLSTVDPAKLNPGRKKRGDDTYGINDLRAIARTVGLTPTGTKADLVARIKDMMLRNGLLPEEGE